MTRVCFYIMRRDSGFAPNPFYRVCTLAACTPNHMKHPPLLRPGDIIAGVFRAGQPPRLVYAMTIDEILDLDTYYRDRRFRKKKPGRKGWRSQDGDNIHFRVASGRWQQDARAAHHRKTKCDGDWLKDVRGNRVYIGRKFIYFGEKAVLLPSRCIPYLPGRGIKYLRSEQSPSDYRSFAAWLKTLGTGIHGLPRDREKSGPCGNAPCNS